MTYVEVLLQGRLVVEADDLGPSSLGSVLDGCRGLGGSRALSLLGGGFFRTHFGSKGLQEVVGETGVAEGASWAYRPCTGRGEAVDRKAEGFGRIYGWM
jgi:hypothetical protein